MCTLQSACTFRRNVGSLLFVPFILPQHDTIVQLDARRDETRRELHGSSTEFHRPSSTLAAQPCSGSGKNEGQMYCVQMVVPSISNSPTCTMAMKKLHRFRLNSPNLSPSATLTHSIPVRLRFETIPDRRPSFHTNVEEAGNI